MEGTSIALLGWILSPGQRKNLLTIYPKGALSGLEKDPRTHEQATQGWERKARVGAVWAPTSHALWCFPRGSSRENLITRLLPSVRDSTGHRTDVSHPQRELLRAHSFQRRQRIHLDYGSGAIFFKKISLGLKKWKYISHSPECFQSLGGLHENPGKENMSWRGKKKKSRKTRKEDHEN